MAWFLFLRIPKRGVTFALHVMSTRNRIDLKTDIFLRFEKKIPVHPHENSSVHFLHTIYKAITKQNNTGVTLKDYKLK